MKKNQKKTIKEEIERYISWTDEKELEKSLDKALSGFMVLEQIKIDNYSFQAEQVVWGKLRDITKRSLIMNIKDVFKGFYLKINKKVYESIKKEVRRKDVYKLKKEKEPGVFDEVFKMVESPKDHWKGLLVLAIFTGYLELIDNEPKAIKRFHYLLKQELKQFPERKERMSPEVKSFLKRHNLKV